MGTHHNALPLIIKYKYTNTNTNAYHDVLPLDLRLLLGEFLALQLQAGK